MEFLLSAFYVFLALLGLGFLVFIHELGHYFMARHVGMRVETFAIGFGRSIYEWKRDGVTWKIGWIPFGGYVRMAGMEEENGVAPEDNLEGFFGRSPWDRIKVAAAGPLVNIFFAMLLFSCMWFMGGREKSFSDHSKIIGWVDPSSELYKEGVRPGDRIQAYNGHNFQRAHDHLQAAMLSGEKIQVEGEFIHSQTGAATPFDYKVHTQVHPYAVGSGLKTSGVLQSARYIVYDKMPDGSENPLMQGAPLQDSGLQYGDRIYWIDGEIVYSLEHLSHILNAQQALVTVRRGGETLQFRVPRIQVGELRLDDLHRQELEDWQHEASLKGEKLAHLQYLPYNLDAYCTVENAVGLIDADRHKTVFPAMSLFDSHQRLKKGDRIIAVDGMGVDRSFDLLQKLQDNQVHIIVDRGAVQQSLPGAQEADGKFVYFSDHADLEKIIHSIGTANPVKKSGRFHLLQPVVPSRQLDFIENPKDRAELQAKIAEQRQLIETSLQGEDRQKALNLLDQQVNNLVLGVSISSDQKVVYNPGPWALFTDVLHEIYSMLSSLFSGNLSPKWVSGPVGIVQVMQKSFGASLGEALYWMAAISLNLGILNLLPLPVLDGGYIVMSAWEIITGQRLKPQTVERLVIPFAILIMGLLGYLLFNDLSRIFG